MHRATHRVSQNFMGVIWGKPHADKLCIFWKKCKTADTFDKVRANSQNILLSGNFRNQFCLTVRCTGYLEKSWKKSNLQSQKIFFAKKTEKKTFFAKKKLFCKKFFFAKKHVTEVTQVTYRSHRSHRSLRSRRSRRSHRSHRSHSWRENFRFLYHWLLGVAILVTQDEVRTNWWRHRNQRTRKYTWCQDFGWSPRFSNFPSRCVNTRQRSCGQIFRPRDITTTGL